MSDKDNHDWAAAIGAWQAQAHAIPSLVQDQIRKSKMEFGSPAHGYKSLTADPLAVQYALGYKDRKYSLTYDVLKRIPHQLGIVAAILQTRCNQVAAFSVPYRASKSVGYVIKHKDSGRETSEGEKQFIADLEKFVYNCGAPDPNPYNRIKRDDFETFLKKIVRDSLMYDQSCAVAGTWVELADGTGVPIESVEAGMKVRTHTGTVKSVIHPTQRLYTGNMIRLQVRGQVLEVTEGHPIYVAQRINHLGNAVELSEPSWMAAKDVTPDMYVVYPRLNLDGEYSSLAIFDSPARKYPVGPLDELLASVRCHPKTAHQVLTGRYTKNGPIKKAILNAAKELGVSYQCKRTVEPTTKIDEDWGFILGLYLAEGNIRTNDSGIAFTFHEKETHLVQAVKSFGDRYGINSTTVEYQDRAGITIILNSKSLALFIKQQCGTGSALKRVPSFVLTSPKSVKAAVLSGYLQGDGCIRTNKASFTTVSRDLFTGTRALLSAFGIYVGEVIADDNYSSHKVAYRGNISGEEYRSFADYIGFPTDDTKGTRRTSVVSKDNIFISITGVEYYPGVDVPVYNMEVEEDHSYIAQGFINHNCFEIVPDRLGQPYEFVAVDASTVRIASSDNVFGPDNTFQQRSPIITNRLLQPDERAPFKALQMLAAKKNNEHPSHVQVINGQIENVYYRDELAFGVRNPRTDIYIQGYGYGEMEQLITILTAHLYAEEYNRRFFMQGSAPKGLLNFKGENFTPDMLEGFKRQWRANLEGVENCVAGSTRIYTQRSGFDSIENICGGEPEVPVTIWTGTSWETGLVYKTEEPKILCKTLLDNGVELSTSPDHKIRVLGDTGDPSWRVQSDLQVGDVVLVNKEDTSADTQLMCMGKLATPEFMEVLGWFLGDGNVYFKTNDLGYSAGATISLFYHQEKEQTILDSHLSILQEYFPSAKKRVYSRSEEQIDKIKKSYGFKSVSKEITSITLCSADAGRWLISNQFCSDDNVKTIPPRVFTMPKEYRLAYLRGVFSADGNNHKGRHPMITISNDVIRSDVKHLLNSVGVRTCLSEGKTKVCDVKTRERIEAPSLLRVKDGLAFFKTIGFLQDHKQPTEVKNTRELGKSDKVPPSTLETYLLKVRASNKDSKYTLLTKRERLDLNSILSGRDGCSKNRLIRYLKATNIPVPPWMTSYNTASVVSTENTGLLVPMYDVSVDHDDHMFMGDNVLKSNSWKTPILQAEQGVEWIDLHPSNREMEYGQWVEYLIKITCFTGDTPVVLADGSLKDIDQIEPGELVSTHTGRTEAVQNVQRTHFEGPLHHIRAGEVIKTTPEHPFYVSRSTYNSTTRLREFDEPSWVVAKDIVEGLDYLLVPKKTYQKEGTQTEIDLLDYVTENFKEKEGKIAPNANRVSWAPRHIPLTPDVAFVLGLYASEGNTTDSGIFFTFSSEEPELQTKVVDVFAELGVYAAPYQAKETTSSVRITCSILARAFSAMFGSKALNKKVPTELMNAPKEIQKAFISGVIVGDGSVSTFSCGAVTVTLSSVSDTLLEQVRHLFLCQNVYSRKYGNIKCSGSFENSSPAHRLDINGTQAVKVSSWLLGVKGDRLRARIENSKQIKSQVYESNSYFMVPVSEHWTEQYAGDVYNIEVSEDHTYQVNRFAVHNCAVFLLDPAELNFDLHGGVQQTPLFESSQEWKLKASRDRGLKPLLRFVAKQINEHIISPIDDHFVFDFVGLDELTEQEKHELRQEQVASYMTVNEIRRAEDLPDLPDGDMIQNPTYLQAHQLRMQADQEEAAQADQQQAGGSSGAAPPDEAPAADDLGQQKNSAPEYAGTFRKSLDSEDELELDLDAYKDLFKGK